MAHSEDQGHLLPAGAGPSDEHGPGLRLLTRRPTYQAVRRVLFQRHTNVVFLLIPIGLAAGLSSADVRAVFILNFFAVLTLAPVIAVMTRELSETTGPTVGGLLKAALCNGAEMAVGIMATIRGEVRIAQSSLIGTILSYCLLILGSGFLLAGYGRPSVSFAQKATSVMESLMMVTSVALIIPTAVSSSFVQPEQTDTRDNDALILSRGTAVVLIILFVQYLYFHLVSHSYLFSDGENGSQRQFSACAPSRCTAVTILISCILAVAACANYLVRSIPAFSKATGLSQTFVSIIIIPFAGNALKWANLMTLFRENANVATKLVIASILQISLLVLPLLVLVGWMAGQTMTLDFDEFEASLLLLAIIVVNGIVQDGKATYFEGAMLMGTYVVVSVAFYVRPEI